MTAADSANARAAAAFSQSASWDSSLTITYGNHWSWMVAPAESLVLLYPSPDPDLEYQGPVRALDAITGRPRWSAGAANDRLGGVPYTHEGTVYVLRQDREGQRLHQGAKRGPAPALVALDARTGAERWTLSLAGTRATLAVGLAEVRDDEANATAGVAPGILAVVAGFPEHPERKAALKEQETQARQRAEEAAAVVRELEARTDSIRRQAVCKPLRGKDYERCSIRESARADSAAGDAARARSAASAAYDNIRGPFYDGPLRAGDVIITVGDRTVDSTWTVERLVALHRPGDSISVEVARRKVDRFRLDRMRCRGRTGADCPPPFEDGYERQRLQVRLYGEPVLDRWWTEVRAIGSDVYVGRDSTFLVVDAGSGAVRHTIQLRTEASEPALDDSTLYYFGDRTGMVRALDRRTGAERWTTRAVLSESRIGGFWLTRADSTLYAASDRDGLFALDARTGKIRWSHNTEGSARAVVADGRVYVQTANGKLIALDAQAGTRLWGSPGGGEIAVADGEVVYSAGRALLAVNAASGERKWTRVISSGGTPVVMAHGLVYYADVGLSAIGRSQLLAMAQEAAEAEQKRAAALAQERRRCQPVLAEISRRRMKNEDAMAYAMRYNCETLIVP